MLAKHASFGDDLAQAYGITWVEDLFAPADEDSRYTTDVEAFLGAQQEWLSNNLPKRGALIEANEYGQAKLPAKAQQVYGKGDLTGWYINARDGSVQSVAYRMPEAKKPKLVKDADGVETVVDELEAPKARPDVTQKGLDMIGDLCTDALHEALARAPIENDTLTALLVLALTGQNVTIASGASDNPYGQAKCAPHAVRLVDEDGKLSFDRDTLGQVARSVLIEVLSLQPLSSSLLQESGMVTKRSRGGDSRARPGGRPLPNFKMHRGLSSPVEPNGHMQRVVSLLPMARYHSSSDQNRTSITNDCH
ncbi:UNVERIFIED_ORG: hypothetical protein M2435_006914 [Rhizobium sophorae]|nr:hypothetical protein [Rhizobium leguminosarum]MDH6663967.1 hypothetical protein [Rhizobium sophorae]